MIYSADDLLWSDGLEDLRTLLDPKPLEPDQPMPTLMQCSTLADMAWWCSWKQLPVQSHKFSALPEVATAELLQQLGMTAEQCVVAMKQLSAAQLPDLQRLVLPAFVTDAVEAMAAQLPELPLLQQMQQHKLFVGYSFWLSYSRIVVPASELHLMWPQFSTFENCMASIVHIMCWSHLLMRLLQV